VDALVARGDSVVVYDNLFSGKEANLAHVRDRIEFVRADVRDLDTLRRVVAGADYVLHQAAVASVPRSVRDPETTTTANVIGTMNVLIAARDVGVKRVTFAASSSAYGETEVSPQSESLLPGPVSPYAASKVAGELYCRVFHKAYGTEAVSLRYFNVFGPRQDPDSEYAAVIPKFITSVLAGKRPVIYGTGKQSRDFCYIDNVVSANLLALTAPDAGGRVFNVACGDSHDLLELLRIICDELGRHLDPVFEPVRAGDVMHTHADISAIRAGLGYRVLVDFSEGIRRTVRWFAEHTEPAA
jgi:UDP-glucose 4-epimerase